MKNKKNENQGRGISGLKSAVVILLTLILVWISTGCGSDKSADSGDGSGTEVQAQAGDQDVNVADGGAVSDGNVLNDSQSSSDNATNQAASGQTTSDQAPGQAGQTDPAADQQNPATADGTPDQAITDPANPDQASVANPTGESSGSQDETGAADKALSANSGAGKDLVIPVSDISEKASFYPLTVDGTALEVLAVKAPDGSIRTAFNTCQVCFDSGRGYYKQVGSALVCQNCGNRFGMDKVEVSSGGCNPVPIFAENKTVTDENITIPYDFLKEATVIFADWKSDY